MVAILRTLLLITSHFLTLQNAIRAKSVLLLCHMPDITENTSLPAKSAIKKHSNKM